MSGALTSLAFPPADLGVFGFVSLVPLALVFGSARAPLVAVAGAAFGGVFFALLLTWILLFGWAAFISLVLLQVGWVVLLLVVAISTRDRLPLRVRWLAFPLAIVAGEYLRSHLPFTGFTWGGLGYTQHDATGVLRLASYTGVWGISFLVATTAALVAQGILAVRRARRRALVLAGASLLLGVAPVALPVIEPDGTEARIAAIQGNQPEDPGALGSDDLSILLNHSSRTDELDAEDLSLVIWPEEAAGGDPLERDQLRRPLTEAIKNTKVPFLVGARAEVGESHFRNQSLFFDREGRLVESYDKMRLVPFGEFVPGRSLLAPIFSQLERVPKDGIPGDRLAIFEIPEGKFASVICFESTFPDLVSAFVRKGAGLVAVITDNASFERTVASRQHLIFSQLRAAENRVWIAHAALSGISGMIAPDGRVVSRTRLFEPATLVQTVRWGTDTTLYTRWGDWLPRLCVVIVGLFFLTAVGTRLRGKRRRNSNAN